MEMYSFQNLIIAYQLARRNNRYKKQVCQFDFFLEQNLSRLQWELQTGRYIPSPYHYFIVREPKTRHVAAPHFRDRVLHHALIRTIEPVFEKMFIADTFACRKNKGTHMAMKRVKHFLQEYRSIYGKDIRCYALQCDISRFFPSISWDILLSLIEKKIDSPELMEVIRKIVTTHSFLLRSQRASLFPTDIIDRQNRKGLPIGNLTSQLFANLYLNPMDHFIKETLRERWYGRYMDDFFILHHDSKHLVQVREKIREFLWENLRLTIHPRKSSIIRAENGVAFVGYRIFYDHVVIRANTLRRFERKVAKKRKLWRRGKIEEEMVREFEETFHGHLKFANAYGLKRSFVSRRKKS